MICICDYRTPRSVLVTLKSEFEVIQLPPDPSLPQPVQGHIDLLLFILQSSLITRSSYYRIARHQIDLICKKAHLKLILSDESACNKYPKDCGLCAVVAGDNIICRLSSTDSEILRLADYFGCRPINVPQGYSKCSCAILADGAAITADRGIAAVTLKNSIPTLLISEGHIDLPGYPYGFIGGATGLCGDKLYFCGDLSAHPDCKAIEEFAFKHNTVCVSLSNDRLYDVGSLFFV